MGRTLVGSRLGLKPPVVGLHFWSMMCKILRFSDSRFMISKMAMALILFSKEMRTNQDFIIPAMKSINFCNLYNYK